MAQRDSNPYKYTDSNKRYMTYDWYMKKRFGGKIAKVPLDVGCTCPNIDGTRGRGGCIYCKSGSRAAIGDNIEEQYRSGVDIARRKWKPVGFIPYLQSNTNTYGSIERLRTLYRKSASLEGAVMLDIATRADCLGSSVIDELCSVAEIIPLTVELGLQTSNDSTAALINRCHSFDEFCEGYFRLKSAADAVNLRFENENSQKSPLMMKRITISVHLINGLPGEGYGDMLRTARDVATLQPDMVKIHLMYVLRGTRLAEMYSAGAYTPMEMAEYVRVTCDQLEILPPETVIGRITGDGAAEDLLAPEWSCRKTAVANEIDKELYRRGAYQGKSYV